MMPTDPSKCVPENRSRRFGPTLALSLCLLALAACGGDRPAAPPAGVVIDTLSHGGVRVSNPEQGVWEANPGSRWTLVEELRIGGIDGEGPEAFGSVGYVIEGPLGRIWVADGQAAELRVFEQDGRFVRTVGRRGEGPGEFGRLGGVHLAPDGTVWVDDANARRWVVFDSAGVHVGGHPGDSNMGGGQRRWMADGRLVEFGIAMDPSIEPALALVSSTPTYSVRRLESSGSLSPPDTVTFPASGEQERLRFVDSAGRTIVYRSIPHRPTPRATLGFNGDLWISEGGDRYVIHRIDLGGDTLLTVERAFTPVPLSDEARAHALAELEPPEGLRPADTNPNHVPGHHAPVYGHHPSSDGSLWVVSVQEGGGQALDVFDAGGLYLGSVELPPALSRLLIRHITEDRIYGVVQDDLGVASVVVARIARGG